MNRELTISIQEMINDYLDSHGKLTITEMMKRRNQVEKEGILTPAHNIVLQQMIREYLKEQGISIDNEMKNGKQILGALSNTEIPYIIPLLNRYNEKKQTIKKVA